MDTQRHQGSTCTEERTCEEIATRWPSTSQGEKPQKTPNQLIP